MKDKLTKKSSELLGECIFAALFLLWPLSLLVHHQLPQDGFWFDVEMSREQTGNGVSSFLVEVQVLHHTMAIQVLAAGDLLSRAVAQDAGLFPELPDR